MYYYYFFDRFSELTYSFWGCVWVHLDDFINPLFSPTTAALEDNLILPATDIPHLRCVCMFNYRGISS